MKRITWLLLPLLTACGVQGAQVAEEGDDAQADGLALTGETGADTADHGCQVVLRSVAPVPNATGSQLELQGTIDVAASAIAAGSTPYVLYRSAARTTWSKVKASVSSGNRYVFQLSSHTLSTTPAAGDRLLLVPYLLTRSGARVFDHNRNPGALADDVLSAANGFAIGEDLAVCGSATRSRLDFSGAWQQTQTGALVAGGHARVTYDLSRLPDCRGTHNGYPAWDLRAFVRFSGGQQLDGTVRGFNSPNGVPSNASAISVPFDFEVPSDATGVDVWFENSDGAGMSCTGWDSNYGANYHFTVEPAAPAAIGWNGDVGSSTARDCIHRDGVADPLVFTDYIYERACAFVEVDVYVPGLTDAAVAHPEYLWASAAQVLDGAELAPAPMTFQGRVGNNYRFRYEVPRQQLFYAPKWSTLSYTPRFSTDAVTFASQPARAITRDATFCNPSWNGCSP